MIKGAIFDFDGTLFDSMFIWESIGESYLRSIGIKPKQDVNETVKALSLYQAACYFQREYGVDLSALEIMNGVNEMVERFYKKETLPKPHAVELLRRFHNKGVKMCIATATDRYLIEAALKRCGISKYFSGIFTCTEVGHGKDEPHIFRQALEHLGVNKKDAIVFEDSLYAVKTAKSDGFTTVAVFDRHEKNQTQLKKLADFYIEDLSQFNI